MTKGQQALQMKAEGKTNAEIAEALGMPKPSVRRLISEAKQAALYMRVGEPQELPTTTTCSGSTDGIGLRQFVATCQCGSGGTCLQHIGETPAQWIQRTSDREWMLSGGSVRPLRSTIYDPPLTLKNGESFTTDDEADAKAVFMADALRGVRLADMGVQGKSIPEIRQEAGLLERVASQRPTRWIVIPDTQVKPGVPTDHLYWAGRYIAEKTPDVVVHLGDHWDFPSLSSYEKPGSAYFEGKRVKADIEAGNRGLERLEAGMGGFRPKRKVLIRGNHEDRLRRALNDEPRLEGLVGYDQLNDVALGWEVVDFLVPIEIDGLWLAHYFANPMTGRPYSGNPETMLKNVGHSFVQGHQQGLRVARRELATGQVQRALIAGSFYEHQEDYLGAQGNKHWRGILVLNEVSDGSYDLTEVSLNYLKRSFA